jgi:bilin biosynthesis protein
MMTDPILMVQAQNDALVAAVNEQITLGTFDHSDRQVLKQLVDGLGDTRGLVRLRFAETLGEIGEAATPLLIDALANDANVVVRRAAAKTLTLIGDPSAVSSLLYSFLNDPDTVVKSSAAGALARTGVTAAPALLDILGASDYPEDIKGLAAWALAFMGSEATEYLYAALSSDSLDIRCAVVGAIGRVAQENSDQKSCDLLVKALADPEALIRSEAATALGQVPYLPAVPSLILAIEDSDLDVRKSAINSLGKISDRAAIEPLQAVLNDQEQVIRVLAKLAIAQIERQSESDVW